ncbi:MAG: sterol carrier protein domain-containing protein, partial [Treponema sp.]|nr:sterol carrier protein domain-containing protein [Treponema sp.]
KFGYEIACARNNIKIPTKIFSVIKPQGEFVPVLPGDDTSLLAEVHSAYIADINHGIHRDYWPDNRSWKNFTNDEPCATGIFIYLWKDETGKARSYVKYQDTIQDDEHNMSVLELAFIDKKGLYGVFGLVGGLSTQYRNFRWPMPTFIDPFDFTGDAWAIEQNIVPRDMTRVVNVKAALEMMRRPLGEGSYILEVKDENIMANNGKYLVEFGREGSRVSSTEKDADIHLDIRVLSQLVTGYRTLENTMYSRQSGVEIYRNEETLKRVFTLRPQHITEYF